MAGPGGDDSENYYRILQVDCNAEPEVIEAAYRALSKKYHPDRNATPDGHDRMSEINAAYDVVGNEAKRAEYDERRNLAMGVVGVSARRTTATESADASAASDFDSPGYTPPTSSTATDSPDHFDRRARRFVYTYTPTRSRSATVWRIVFLFVLLAILMVAILIFLQALAISGINLPFPLPHFSA